MPDSISPPPTKRRRFLPPPSENTISPIEPPLDALVPPEIKRKNTTLSQDVLKIYAWNINGIKPFIQKPITDFFSSPSSPNSSTAVPPASLRSFLSRHAWPHVLFLQEVKISPDDLKTQNAVKKAVSPSSTQDDGPDYGVYFALPTCPFNARGFGRKVYGVCSIVRKDFIARHGVVERTVEWDKEGRFHILETDGKRPGWPKLSIWNVYAVNGTEYDYKSPVDGRVIGSRHDRKVEVHKLMTEECLELEKKGFKVILGGDMNIARDEKDGWPGLRIWPERHVQNRRDFNMKMFDQETGLAAIDTFRKVNGKVRKYSYHSRGVEWGSSCDRVDYIICSKTLQENLSEADILDTIQERGPSDHVPVYAAFYFGKPEKDLSNKDDKFDEDDQSQV